MRKLICFLLISLPFLSISQEVTIEGNALFFKNEKIQISHHSNRLTPTKKLITSDQINSDGSFALNFTLQHPEELVIKIEMREIHLHLHPNTQVYLEFLPFENASNQRNPMPYKIRYTQIPDNVAADSIYGNLQSDFAKHQLRVNKRVYDNFFKRTDSLYANYLNNDHLFATFYLYFKGEVYLQTNTSKTQLIKEYIVNQPINYQSREYLKFCNVLLNSRINSILSKNPGALEKALKEYRVYESLLSLLYTDSIFDNTELRNLALFSYTTSTASNNYLDTEVKAAIISQISNSSPYANQSEAARTFQFNHQKFSQNREAPLFGLHNKQGDSISIESYRGKTVYLGFIHSKSATCQKDLILIKNLSKKYRKAKFIMVLSDRDSIQNHEFIQETNNLIFLYLNKNYNVLETYQIWNFPVYYLIDKHGYFIQAPANRPEEMYDTFNRLYAPKSKRKSYEIIKD